MSIHQKAKGKWWIRWRDENGKARLKTFLGTKAEAKKVEREIRQQVFLKKMGLQNNLIENSTDEISKEILYADFLIEFCELHQIEYSEYNAKGHLQAGARLIKHVGSKPLEEYRTADLLSLRADIIEEGRKPRTANATLINIQAQFRKAVELDYLEKYPFRSIKPLPESQSARRAFPMDELLKIVSMAEEPYNHVLTLSCLTGMRAGEIFKTQIEDIKENVMILHISKTKKAREIPLIPMAKMAVEKLRGERKTGRLITTHKKAKSFVDLLAIQLKVAYYRFQNAGEDPPSKMRNCIQRNIRGITTQDIRHSHTSFLQQQNVNPEIRARLAGNSKEVNQRVYTHIPNKSLMDTVEKAFGAVVGGELGKWSSGQGENLNNSPLTQKPKLSNLC